MDVGSYSFEVLVPPLSEALIAEIDSLLQGYGPHFEADFGLDFRARLREVGGVVLCLGRDASTGTIAAHAAAAFDALSTTPLVGTFGWVFTAPAHRKRGLSTAVVRRVVARFDAIGGRWLILGTGSRAAAKVHTRKKESSASPARAEFHRSMP